MPLHNVDAMIDRLIEREGGYVNHPLDPGGETKYGITKRSYPDLNIQGLSRTEARDIYERDFYRRFSLDQLSDPRTAEWILDWLVHSGPGAIRHIQRELGVAVDSVMGQETLGALNQLKDPKDILRWRMKFLVKLTKHPFISGWINRLIKLGL